MYYIFPYDNQGNLYPHPYYGTEQTMSNAPNGYALLDAIEDTDITAKAAFDACEILQSQQYIVQSGKLVANLAWSDIELANAKEAKTAEMTQTYGAAMAAGFTSSADGTSRTYIANATTIQDVGLARTITEATYPTTGIEAELLDGTYVTLDYAQMQTLSNDLQAFYLPMRSKSIKLLGQIKDATTVAEVQAISW